MITNREEVIDKAFKVFLKMNYEKASISTLANACGVALSEKDARSQMEYTREFPAYKTSMLQDFEAGRELEVEAILGNAVRLAHQNNVPVPKMEACYALLKSVNLHRS